MIVYICLKKVSIRDPKCSISSLISFMNSDAVHGPERCTINSTPPGVSRVLGTDSWRATVSNWEAMDNMNIMCHWVINQINFWADDFHRTQCNILSTTETELYGTLVQNYQLLSVWLGSGPRTGWTFLRKQRTHTKKGEPFTSSTIIV